MIAFAVLFLSFGLVAPFVGRAINRFGASKVIALGALTVGIGFFILSSLVELWQLYLGNATIGIGMAAAGYITHSTVVLNWFKKRKGLAVGIMSMGIGVGGFALSLLIGGYVIPNFGWRAAYIVLALLTSVVVSVLALAVIKTKPSDIGLNPDGAQENDQVRLLNNTSKDNLNDNREFTLNTVVKVPAFWLIVLSFTLMAFSNVGVTQSQVPYLGDIGFPAATAALVLGGVSLMIATGQLGFGWLCDHMPVKFACAIGQGLQLIGIIVLLFCIKPDSPPFILWLYVILYGLGVGCWLPTMSIITRTSFGTIAYAQIFGVASLFRTLGVALGPLIGGYLFDITDTYQWTFMIYASLYLISIPAIIAVHRPAPTGIMRK